MAAGIPSVLISTFQTGDGTNLKAKHYFTLELGTRKWHYRIRIAAITGCLFEGKESLAYRTFSYHGTLLSSDYFEQ
jgi:hypothetical protein